MLRDNNLRSIPNALYISFFIYIVDVVVEDAILLSSISIELELFF
jgi:hypothetical protein